MILILETGQVLCPLVQISQSSAPHSAGDLGLERGGSPSMMSYWEDKTCTNEQGENNSDKGKLRVELRCP